MSPCALQSRKLVHLYITGVSRVVLAFCLLLEHKRRADGNNTDIIFTDIVLAIRLRIIRGLFLESVPE